jgi:hypothetical protein
MGFPDVSLTFPFVAGSLLLLLGSRVIPFKAGNMGLDEGVGVRGVVAVEAERSDEGRIEFSLWAVLT